VLPYDRAAVDAVALLGRGGLPGGVRLGRRCGMPLGCTRISIVGRLPAQLLREVLGEKLLAELGYPCIGVEATGWGKAVLKWHNR
jgi:hypothetical protein